MKMYLKKRKKKIPIKWIFILMDCVLFVFTFLHGWQIFKSPCRKNDFVEIEMKQEGRKIKATISPVKNLIWEISDLTNKQETVNLYFYNEHKEITEKKGVVLSPGYNNLGPVEEKLICIQYEGNSDFTVNHMYIASGYYFDWGNAGYVFCGISTLCLIQGVISSVKKKYVN